MSKEQIAFWGAVGLSARVGSLETRTTLNEENLLLLNGQVGLLNNAVFPVIYGSFSSTQTQAVPQDNTGIALTYDTTDIAQGCALSGGNPTPKVQVSATGIYRILMSIQVDRSLGGNGDLYAYPMINSTPVPNSTTKLHLSNNTEQCLTVEFIVQMTQDQTVSIHCWSGTAGQEAVAIPSTANYPAIPSIILTVNRIG